ncbi:MAG: DNA polymerase III subunit gamma/tau [Candidatus Kerfeldbacteria bacterium]
MATSLYQKYRPQTFFDLVGQDHVRQTLLNELKSGAVAHAYLFSGPRGIGKTTTARLLARAVNCEQLKDGEPCNVCINCRSIHENKALDIVEIDAASHTGVDNVRENIIDNARVAPSVLQWKVFIIDEVHMLSTSAFNALLKTLEEPPSRTMFILATTEIHKVPATIISRCERFNFRKISFDDMVGRLKKLVTAEGKRVDDEVLHAVAKRSEGALRDAESLLGQVLSLDEKQITAEMAEIVLPRSDMSEVVGLWEEIVRGQASNSISRINRLLEEGVMLNDFTKDMIEFLRKVLLHVVQQSLVPLQYLDLSKEDIGKITTLAQQKDALEISRMLEAFLEAQEQLKAAAIPQLPLELAVIKLAAGNGSPAAPADVPEDDAPSAPGSSGAGGSDTQHPIEPAPPQPASPAASFSQREVAAPEQEPGFAESSAPVREVSLDYIQKKWTTLLKEMKRANHALHLTFKVGQLVSYEDGEITMGYEYKFYEDRLNDLRNRKVIDDVFEKVFGRPISIQVDIDSKYAAQASKEKSNIEQPPEEELANVWDLATSTFDSSNSG